MANKVFVQLRARLGCPVSEDGAITVSSFSYLLPTIYTPFYIFYLFLYYIYYALPGFHICYSLEHETKNINVYMYIYI